MTANILFARRPFHRVKIVEVPDDEADAGPGFYARLMVDTNLKGRNLYRAIWLEMRGLAGDAVYAPDCPRWLRRVGKDRVQRALVMWASRKFREPLAEEA